MDDGHECEASCPCSIFMHIPVAMLLADRELHVCVGNAAFWVNGGGC